jgi:hypothetical protein
MYTGILVNHQPSELDRKIKNRYIRLGLTILFSNQPECIFEATELRRWFNG